MQRSQSPHKVASVDSDNFVVLDGTMPVNKLQKQMRDIVASRIDLKRFAPRPEVTE